MSSCIAKPVRILYASQTGTAKAFAYEMAGELANTFGPGTDTTVAGLHQFSRGECPSSLLNPKHAVHIFLASVAGAGDFPGNARAFQRWMNQEDAVRLPLQDMEYSVFGLGNKDIFPDTYNLVGKEIDTRLADLGGTRLLPLVPGNDGE